MKIKHSKYKNTGLLFELLVRQITADTLNGGESPSLNILKKSFAKTELGKEYKLYETLFKTKNLSEGKAEITLNAVLEATRKLNRSALKREKYNLIKEIQQCYNVSEFFKHQVPNYKGYAAFYKLTEIYNSDKLSETNQIIDNKITILECLTERPISQKKVKQDLVEEFAKYDKDLRVLTYKVMLEKFNGKYANLNGGQKEVLKEFMNSIDNTPRLKEIYNSKINEVKNSLKLHAVQVKDGATKIKLLEVVTLLKEIDKGSRISNDDLINLLQYYELTEELNKANQ
tara:strand:+ start:3169 stop:4026 length:858 start_codon:yes stop_codon:yes gene_type:complete